MVGSRIRKRFCLQHQHHLAKLTSNTVQHDLLPRFARCRSKQHLHGLWEILEIVVAIDFVFRIDGYLSEDLHPDHSIDKEEHHN